MNGLSVKLQAKFVADNFLLAYDSHKIIQKISMKKKKKKNI